MQIVEYILKAIGDIRNHPHFWYCCVPLTAMKGEHLFANMRSTPFLQRVYLLGGEELVVLQSTMGESSLGDSFQQITDFNDLPTSLFACNVDQSVFEDHEGKVRWNGSSSPPVTPNGIAKIIVSKIIKTFQPLLLPLFRLQSHMIGWV